MTECPFCEAELDGAAALDGHLRLSHPENPRARKLVRQLRLRRSADRVLDEMGFLTSHGGLDSEVPQKCREARDRAAAEVDRIVAETRQEA